MHLRCSSYKGPVAYRYAGEKGREAIGAVREVGGNVVDAVDKSLKQRPYTALALAVGLGFLFGAIWRR